MQQAFLSLLKTAGQAPSDPVRLLDALKRLDHLLAEIAADLKVEYVGPCVGLGQAPEIHRLVVREHVWHLRDRRWGVAICSAQAGAAWRADWPLYAASRERRQPVLRNLPFFFSGYQEAVEAAGLSHRNAAKRIAEIARHLQS